MFCLKTISLYTYIFSAQQYGFDEIKQITTTITRGVLYYIKGNITRYCKKGNYVTKFSITFLQLLYGKNGIKYGKTLLKP